MQSDTPLTDELKRRLAEYQRNQANNTSTTSTYGGNAELLTSTTNDSNTSSTQISPRGVASHHHQPRAGSIEADQCGWIEGTAVTDGTTDLDPNTHGVKTDGVGAIAPLKRIGGGSFSLSYAGKNKDSYGGSRSGSQEAYGGGGYSQPTFNDRSFGTSTTNTNGNNLMTSGINSTPRGGAGGMPPLGARNGENGYENVYGARNNNNTRGGAGYGTSGGVASPPLSSAWKRTAPQPGQVDPDAPEYNGDRSTGRLDDDGLDDDGEYDEEYDEEEDDFDENDDADVLPKRYRPEVKTGPLAANGRRGLAHQQDDEGRNELERKAEFESFNVISGLLDHNGASSRRDLLDYHTPYPFLQFLEQLMCGAYFIRFYPRHGTPHERYLYLRLIEVEPGIERPFFCQCKHATAVQIDDAVPVSDLVGVVAGDDAPAFRRQKVAEGFVKGSFVGARRPNFSTKGALSLYFWDRKRQQPRSLDILTTNMAVFRLWKVSAEALVSVNTVRVGGGHPQSEAQSMRAYFLAAQRAVQEAAKASGMPYGETK